MFISGHITVQRSVKEKGWYHDPHKCVVMLHLLIDANYTDQTWDGFTISRGQVYTTYADIAKDCGLSLQNVRTAIRSLVAYGEISTVLTKRKTLITICNYDSYQSAQLPGNIEVTSCQHPSNIEVTSKQQMILKEGNKGNKEKKKENVKEKASELVFPFDSEEFISAWNMLTAEPNWKKKTPHALQLSLNKLGKYPEAFAIKLINDSIEHGWQGVVFNDTDDAFDKWKSATGKQGTTSTPEIWDIFDGGVRKDKFSKPQTV